MMFLSLMFPLAVSVIILAAACNMLIRKKTIQNHYTPFDYIAGQTAKEFHEEKKRSKAGTMMKIKKLPGHISGSFFVDD
ncbi:DUF3951 domain-containing protein [Bacillus sp. NSP9.1]|nr:DUF3951 domain-containing protein [Bacillus sp. NSP9.1]